MLVLKIQKSIFVKKLNVISYFVMKITARAKTHLKVIKKLKYISRLKKPKAAKLLLLRTILHHYLLFRDICSNLHSFHRFLIQVLPRVILFIGFQHIIMKSR